MAEKILLPHFNFLLKKKPGEAFLLRLIVTRKIPRAVDRNRVKRVVREFFRQKRALLPWNVVVCRIAPKAATTPNAILFKELHQLL